MKYKLKKLKDCEHELSMEVLDPQLESRFQEVLRGIQKQAHIRGFRPGKAPLNIVAGMYQKEAEREVIESLVSDAYRECLKEEKIRSVGLPEIKDLKMERGKKLSFKALFESAPQFRLKNMSGVRIKKIPTEITEERMKRALESLAESRVTYAPKDSQGAAAEGDLVQADLEVLKEEKVVSKRKDVVIPVNTKGPEGRHCEALLGAAMGDTREVRIEEKGEGPGREAGGELIYRITLHRQLEKKTPEINDEFAKSLGKENLDALKSEIAEENRRYLEWQAKQGMIQQLFDRLLEMHDMPLPKKVVLQEKNRMLEEHKKEHVHPAPGASGPAHDCPDEKSVEAKAEREVKLYFILETAARELGIEPGPEEVAQGIESLAKEMNASKEEVEKKYGGSIYHNIRRDKTIDSLLLQAAVETEKNAESEMKREEKP